MCSAEFPGLRSAKSLYSLSSEEDLSEQIRDEDSPVEDYPITTESDAESTGDEVRADEGTHSSFLPKRNKRCIPEALFG